MITCNLFGRTANQMFQIATTIAHAHRVGVEYGVPEKSLNPEEWPLLFPHLPKCSPSSTRRYKRVNEDRFFGWTNIPKQDNLILQGYWQNEDYFKDYRDEVIAAFRIPYRFDKGKVAVHVRLGDYKDKFPGKHPPVSREYLEKAMSHFVGYEYVLFSDDIAYCKHTLGDMGLTFADEPDTLAAFEAMQNCEHQIIANSTFSWMAAWFNRNPDKTVVAPRLWFGPGNRHLDSSRIVPKNWVQI